MSILSSDRITLRPITLDIAEEFHAYSLDHSLYDYLEFDPFTSFDESREYLLKLVNRSLTPLSQYYTIHDRNEFLIGTIGYHSYCKTRGCLELGYGLSANYWGQGLFSESLQCIISFLTSTLKVRRISAITASANHASIRSLSRNGFQLEGILRDYYFSHTNSWFDAALLSRIF